MKLISLELKNFKAHKALTIKPDGADFRVLGDNAAGKTTLADAFYWLFFNKDSQGRGPEGDGFRLKTIDPKTGEAIHNLEHTVTADFMLGDGSTWQLEKTLTENWVKSRAEGEREFKGHQTSYKVDGVPMGTEKEFAGKVSGVCGDNEKVMRMLTSTTYFNEDMHWQDRRQLLIKVVGDVPDKDVIDTNKFLAALPKILGRHSTDEYKKIVAARRKKINDDLKDIPTRIDEVQANLPDLVVVDAAELEANRTILAEAEKELIRIQSGGQVAELTRQKADIESEIISEGNRERAARADKWSEANHAYQEGYQLVGEADRLISVLAGEVRNLTTDAERMAAQLADLGAKYRVLFDREYDLTKIKDKCPSCLRPLPEGEVEQATANALATFNEEKAKRLAENKEQGKEIFRNRKDTLQAITDKNAELEQAKVRRDELSVEALRLKDLANALSAPQEKTVASPETLQNLERAKFLESEIARLNESSSEAIKTTEKTIGELRASVTLAMQASARHTQHKEAEARIKALEAEQKELGKQINECDREIALIERFIEAKVKFLTDRINSKFKIARFQLFRPLIQGGLEEVCETMVGNVPYISLNHGAKINVGLDVINTLSEHFGLAPPIFIDNSESITEILPTKGQQIQLVVSAKDKKLRLESIERKAGALL